MHYVTQKCLLFTEAVLQSKSRKIGGKNSVSYALRNYHGYIGMKKTKERSCKHSAYVKST